jgi:hypothetical protein
MTVYTLETYNLDPSDGSLSRTSEILDYKNLSFINKLNGVGTCRFSLENNSRNASLELLIPTRTNVAIKRDGEVVWFGPIVKVSGAKTGSEGDITIECRSYISHLNDRIIDRRIFAMTDIGAIVSTLTTEVQAVTNGDFGITISTETIGDADQTLENVKLGQLIINLSDNQKSFDFIEEYTVDGSGAVTGVVISIKQVHGSLRNDLQPLSYDNSELGFTSEGRVYNDITIRGAGTGDDVVSVNQVNTGSQNAYGVRELLVKDSSAKSQTNLSTKAAALINENAPIRWRLSPSIHPNSGLTYNKLNLGDILNVSYDNGVNKLGTFSGQARLAEISVIIDSVGAEFINPFIIYYQ